MVSLLISYLICGQNVKEQLVKVPVSYRTFSSSYNTAVTISNSHKRPSWHTPIIYFCTCVTVHVCNLGGRDMFYTCHPNNMDYVTPLSHSGYWFTDPWEHRRRGNIVRVCSECRCYCMAVIEPMCDYLQGGPIKSKPSDFCWYFSNACRFFFTKFYKTVKQ